MTLGLAIDYNLLIKEFLIDRAIKYIPNNVLVAAGVGIGVSIFELLREGLVFHHYLELVLHR